MERVTVAFDTVPQARWGPLFHIARVERPNLSIDWKPVDFPRAGRPLLDGADVGLFLAPPPEQGIDSLVIERTGMVVVMAAGHRLARRAELSVADVLDEVFPGAPGAHPEWTAFWTLDEHRGGPPKFTDDDVANSGEGIGVVASGQAVATLPASVFDGLPHPGIVALPLSDGPWVETRLVWRSEDPNPAVRKLVELASHMTGGSPGD
jgi:DNA-binding transcriptional LysR family regulator